jgi:hypothetical protein
MALRDVVFQAGALSLPVGNEEWVADAMPFWEACERAEAVLANVPADEAPDAG